MKRLLFLLMLVMMSGLVLGVPSAPIMESVTISPSPAYTNSTLQGYCNASDVDGDNVSYEYMWYINDTPTILDECLQQTANASASGDDTCELNTNGTYFESEDINGRSTCGYVGGDQPEGWRDGSFDTGVFICMNYQDYWFDVNYSKPNVSLYDDWNRIYAKIGFDSSVYYIDEYIPSECIVDDDIVSLRYFYDFDDVDTFNVTSRCYNGSDYITFGDSYSVSSAVASFYEESIYWAYYQVNDDFTESTSINVANMSSSYFNYNDNVTFECRAYDDTEYSSWVNSTTLNISNAAPVITTTTISPSPAYTNDTLQGYCNASDADGDNVSYNYTWYKNDVEMDVSLYSSSTVGDWFFSASYTYDGDWDTFSGITGVGSEAQLYKTYNLTYIDVNLVSRVKYSTTEPFVSNYFNCYNSSDEWQLIEALSGNTISDFDIPDSCIRDDYTLRLMFNLTSNAESKTNIVYEEETFIDNSGSDQTSYLYSDSFSKDDEIIYSCQVYDGLNYSDWSNSTTLTISNSLPSVTTPVIEEITGGFNCTYTFSDLDSDSDSSYVSWYVNDTLYATYQQKNLTYSTSTLDHIICEVTPNDGEDNNTAVNSTVYYYNYFVPIMNSVSITPATAYTNDTLQGYCNASGYFTNVQYEYVWYVDGVNTSSGTSANQTQNVTYNIGSLASTAFVKTNNVTLACRASDLEGNQSSWLNTSLIISNLAPSASSLVIVSEDTLNYTNSSLEYSYTFTDIDGDSDSSWFEWFEDNVSIYSAQSPYNLTADNTTKNKEYFLNITPNDGTVNGTTVQSNTITIRNSLPVVSDVIVVEDTGVGVNCTYTFSDADSDSETVFFEWYIDDVLQNETDVNLTYAFVGTEEVICQVTPYDGEANGTAVNSSIYDPSDTTFPIIVSYDIPTTGLITELQTFIVECSDNGEIAVGYPKLQYTDPNNIVQGNYTMSLQSGDTYTLTRSLATIGTYYDFIVYCRDGSNNQVTQALDGTLQMNNPPEEGAGGGGGGGSIEEFRELVSFVIDPEVQRLRVAPGGSRTAEVRIENTDIVAISFVGTIIRNNITEETYSWMTFRDGSRTTSFTVAPSGGLVPSQQFISYDIEIPRDIEEGTYYTTIEIVGADEVGYHTVQLTVREGVSLLGFFEYTLFTLPSMSRLVAGDTIEDELGRPVTVFGLFLFLVFATGLFFGGRYLYLVLIGKRRKRK